MLTNRTMENMSSHEFSDQSLSSEYVNLNTAEMFLDQACSVGQRQWNMYMDMEDQSEMVNGVSVYYGGDPYDSEDTEKFDSAVPEGMEFRTPTHSHTDGGETRRLDIVVLGHGPRTHDEELDIAGLCRCPEIEEGEDPPILSDTLHVDTGLDRPEQTGLNCITGACGVDFDVADFDSDTDSIAELEYNIWDDVCAWEFRNAPGNMFDELIRNTSYYTDDDESPEGFGHEGYVDAGIYPPRLCLLQRHNRLDNGIRNDDSLSIHRLYHKQTNYWQVDDMDYPSPVVCYDWKCVMSLIWAMMFLSHDGDGTVNGTGHDVVYDCSPAGIL